LYQPELEVIWQLGSSEGKRGGNNMPRKGYTAEQIISALRQHEAGDKTADICRKLGVSQASFYMWKKQYAGLGVQDLRELRSLHEESGRLKRIVADLHAGPPDSAGDRVKKAVKPRRRRRLARWAQETYRIPMRRAARVVGISWSTMLE
jgi:putative transposase